MSWLLLIMLGCPDTDGGDTADSAPLVSDSEAPCTATVVSLEPSDGSEGVSVYTDVTASFSAAVTSGTFEVDLGVAGATELADDGLSATFTPTAPLEAGLGYTAVAAACDDSMEASFTTATDEADRTLIPGRTYALDLYEANWEKPALIALIRSEFTDRHLLLQVVELETDSGSVSLTGAMGVIAGGGVKQQRCVEPWALEPGTFTNPQLVVGPQTLEIALAEGASGPIEDLTLTGSFTADAEAIEDVLVTGLIDTEPLDEAYGSTLGVTFCEISEEAGESCVPCADGRELCLEAQVSATEMAWVEDLDIDEDYDPGADTSCP